MEELIQSKFGSVPGPAELKRVALLTFPSGTVDLVFNGLYISLEFNCSCLDALPYCKATCCRMRPLFTAEVTEEESRKFNSVKHPQKAGLFVLNTNASGHSCFYLDEQECKCTVHADKPKVCSRWHCSPRGVNTDGTEITEKGKGWFISPL